jgi:predicted enzyme related to lactoylglutathione lyase
MASLKGIHFGNALYKVPDLKAAKQFYSKAFGLPTFFDEPDRVIFKVWRYQLWLVPADSTDEHWEVYGIFNSRELTYWSVKDVEIVYKRFIELGAMVRRSIKKDGPGFMMAIVEDPWGNIIGLHSDLFGAR